MTTLKKVLIIIFVKVNKNIFDKIEINIVIGNVSSIQRALLLSKLISLVIFSYNLQQQRETTSK